MHPLLSSNRFKESELPQLTITLNNIVEAVSPEMIVCYGGRTTTHEDWTSFRKGDRLQTCSAYDVLVVTSDSDSRKEQEILALISRHNTDRIAIDAVVHSISFVEKAIRKNNVFFTTLCRNGVLLYQRNSLTPALPLPENDPVVEEEKLVRYWNKWFGLSRTALRGSVSCFSHRRYEWAAGLAQLAAEYACMAMIRVFTGYAPGSYGLRRLLAFTENFALEPNVVFPGMTQEEDRLFTLLQNAYRSMDLKDGYAISVDTAVILIDRVRDLQEVAEMLYKEKLTEIREVVS